MSFYDHNSSVVSRRYNCRCSQRRQSRRCCRKLFTFSSPPEPQGKFQPNLALSTLG